MLLFFSAQSQKKKPQAGWKLPLCWPGYHSPSDWDVSGTDWGPIAGTSSGQMAPNWSPERTKTLCNNVWPTQHASKTLETPRMNREKHYTIMGNIFQDLHDPRSGSGTHHQNLLRSVFLRRHLFQSSASADEKKTDENPSATNNQ